MFVIAAAVGCWDLCHCWLLATLGSPDISIYGCLGRLLLFIIFISILTALGVCGLLRRWCSSQFVVALAFRRSAQLRTRLCEYNFSPLLLLLWPLAVHHNSELAIASIILLLIHCCSVIQPRGTSLDLP